MKELIWICDKCNKEYNDKTKIIQKLKEIQGLINSIVICPHCEKDGTNNKLK